MKVITAPEDFAGKGSAVALGMFDGVHIGHQALIRETVRRAREGDLLSVVCTFDRNPLEVIAPSRAPKPIFPLSENLNRFERLGADCALVLPFTKAFADLPAEDFLRMLTGGLRAKVVVVGENYTFGRGGRGDASLIRALGPKLRCETVVVPPVMDGERMASSTLIRELLRTGDTEHAQRLLRMDD